MTGISRFSAVVLGITVFLVGCGDDGGGTENVLPAAPVTGEGLPPEAVDHAGEWPLPGQDAANHRAAVDSPISPANVGDLEEAWRVPLPGTSAYGNAATTPVVVDGTVFVQDLQSNVRAIDLESGELLWEKRYDRFQIGPNGTAVGWGRVYVAAGDEAIAALDAETGEELWSTEIVATATEGVDIQPQVFDGLVYASTVPISIEGIYAGGDRGVLHALDAETGAVVWTFDTIEDGEGLWGNPEVNSGGGAWYPPAVDPDRGVMYWGVANPAPFPGTPEFPNGTSRPGPNLYTNSVVALDARTGELQWYRQAVEHDLFDRDLVHTLRVTTDDGEVVVGTGKLGRVIGHDPATGDVLWDTPVGVHRNDELTELDGPTEMWPGTFGGILTPPAAADGIVYGAVLNAPTDLAPDQSAFMGSALGTAPGEVVAVDAVDGSLLWSTEVDGDPLGGATVVGDLVLTATFDGKILALDRVTGEVVAEHQAPGGINGWPAVVGDTVLWPVGMADPEPALVAYRLPDTG